MELKEAFSQATEAVKTLPSRPKDSVLLELYALFKQATAGDVTGSRPGFLDLKGRAKYDAWASKKNMSSESAMTDYINLVTGLLK
jgi:acyl-CoA-binding protein